MVIFWSFAAVLLAVSLVFIWLPFFSRKPVDDVLSADDRNTQNIAIFKQRLAELEKELADNNLDQAGFAALKSELEKNLLQEVDDNQPQPRQAALPMAVPLLLTLCLPVVAAFLYLQWGFSDELTELVENGNPAAHSSASSASAAMTPEAVEEQINKLKEKLQQQPENPKGWLILARTYLALGRYREAADTFADITERFGPFPPILSQHAQALYMSNERSLTPKVQAILDQALALDPVDPGSRGLLGIMAFERRDYQQAIDHWQAVLDSNNPDSNREGLQVAIREARAALAEQTGISVTDQPPAQSAQVQPAPVQSTPAAGADENDGAPAQVRVDLTLDQQLQGQVSGDTTVFVVAQPVSGPRMPLAAVKMTVADLPAKVLLDDSRAVAPMARLSDATEVMVRAIVSHSGNASVQPGDLVGSVGPVKVRGQQAVSLLIDQLVPGAPAK